MSATSSASSSSSAAGSPKAADPQRPQARVSKKRPRAEEKEMQTAFRKAEESELGSAHTGSLLSLRISYTLRKARQCLLCNTSSTDESPLTYGDDEVSLEVQGRVPWRSYEKARADDGEVYKVPSGKLCLVCFNVYRALGHLACVVATGNVFVLLAVEQAAVRERPDCSSLAVVCCSFSFRKHSGVVPLAFQAICCLQGIARRVECTLDCALLAMSPHQIQGLHKAHKKVDFYCKFVSRKGNENEHKCFLQARKAWVKQHNEAGPDRKRLQSKKALLEAKKELKVEQKTGGKFIAPRKQFVSLESWDESKRGPVDQSKVVTEAVFGKSVEGIWVNKGAAGVFDYEEYQDTSLVEQKTVHNSSETPFAEESLARKRKALLGELQEGSQAREKASVEGEELDMAGLLAAIQSQGHAASGQVKGDLAKSDGADAPASDNKSDDSGTSSSEEGSNHAGRFGPTASKKQQASQGLAKAKLKPTATQSSQNKKPAKPHRFIDSSNITGGSAKAKAKPSSAGSQQAERKESSASLESSGTLLADGRAQRALRNLKEKLFEWQQALLKIKVDDDLPKADAQSQAAFRTECTRRASEAKILSRQTRDYSKRMDKSNNKSLFEEDLLSLSRLEQASARLHSWFTLCATGSSASPAEMVAAYENVSGFFDLLSSDAFGSCFQLKYALAKASQHCLYGEYAQYCCLFTASSEEMKPLAQSLGHQCLVESVAAEVEGRILLSLKAIKTADVQAMASGQVDLPTALLEAKDLCEAVVAACAKYGEDDFLASPLKKPCSVASGLLNVADISATASAVEVMEQSQAEEDSHGSFEGAIQVFFSEHAVGQSLVDLATARVASGEKEQIAQTAIKELGDELPKLQALSHAFCVQGIKLIKDDLLPVQKLLDTCAKSVSALKGSKGKDKDHGRAYDRLMELLAGHKATFTSEVKRLLEGELRGNLAQRLHLDHSVSFVTLLGFSSVFFFCYTMTMTMRL